MNVQHVSSRTRSLRYAIVRINMISLPLGSTDVLPLVEADLKRTGERIIEKAKEICKEKEVRKPKVLNFIFVQCIVSAV